MLQRCYSPKSHEKNPNYKGCSVCKEWHTYSKFETWFLSQPNHARVGYELDKDLLANSKTNKIYSPQTCCLLPKELNAMIVFSSRDYADLPSGVYKPDKGKYFISYGGKASFSDKEEAHKEYLRRRKQAINTTANRLFEGGLIEERVYSALLNYKIKK